MNVAESVVSAVGSSSGLERNFSRLGLTYGKLRAQREPEKAEIQRFYLIIVHSDCHNHFLRVSLFIQVRKRLVENLDALSETYYFAFVLHNYENEVYI